MAELVFQHLNPVWREKANHIIGAQVPPLEKYPEEKPWEQLWAKKIGSNRFIICCIPMFSFGLALGDAVETNQELMITKILKPSGYETIRIWFNSSTSKIKEYVVNTVRDQKCLMEWYSPNLLGVSSENSSITYLLIHKLQDYTIKGIISIEIANR